MRMRFLPDFRRRESSLAVAFMVIFQETLKRGPERNEE
jgi:hypothetical protein